MTSSGTRKDKRARLVESGEKLVHEQGFGRTTLADVASKSGVPLGNVYYYFKTKESLGEAIVDRLTSTHRDLRKQWDATADPRGRLDGFIQMTIDSGDSLARSGCPVGTLCAELHKGDGPLAKQAANLFAELLAWLEVQFRALGQGPESAQLAIHLLSAVQGASLLAHTFHSSRYVVAESERLRRWVRSL